MREGESAFSIEQQTLCSSSSPVTGIPCYRPGGHSHGKGDVIIQADQDLDSFFPAAFHKQFTHDTSLMKPYRILVPTGVRCRFVRLVFCVQFPHFWVPEEKRYPTPHPVCISQSADKGVRPKSIHDRKNYEKQAASLLYCPL